MNLDEAIQKRRSIRQYKDQQIPFEKLTLLLEAGRHAPSSGNLQDFKFIIVNDKDKKNKIANFSLKQFWMNEAPVFIVVCSDFQRLKTFYKEKADIYSNQNAAAAAMLLSLKAVDLGLATCWVSVFDQAQVSKILGIKGGIIPQIILTVGYQSEKNIKEKPKIKLSKITFFNEYGTKTTDVKNWIKEKYTDKIKNLVKKLKK